MEEKLTKEQVLEQYGDIELRFSSYYKYSFNYIWGQSGEGVLAQEAMQVVPKAVRYNNGFLEVNYDLIGE